MLVPSAAFKVGDFTILSVGSVIPETEKSHSFSVPDKKSNVQP